MTTSNQRQDPTPIDHDRQPELDASASQPGETQLPPESTTRSRRAAAKSAKADLTPVPAGTTGGEDARRRGWFWHWNSLVTQYAPLIGLKGVGLLNSYTVWTDRREESPHRGYAFPSQQSEADFYGEDRAELITINKILVALDLIEIRKEMVLRTDAQGRRWRVPHNFYRVKDHPDDFTISTNDVLRVVLLAETDRAVYRYTRRLYSPRFSPIDRDNPWHRILEDLRTNPTWQRLATRVEAEETKASNRTKAGHAARKGNETADRTQTDTAAFSVPTPHDLESGAEGDGDSAGVDTLVGVGTSVEPSNSGLMNGEPLDVALTNSGSGVDVDLVNTGLSGIPATDVAQTNRAEPTSVEPINTTYHQAEQPTTTETSLRHRAIGTGAYANGPALPPTDGPGRAGALRAFEEANERPATAAERKLLSDLADRFHPTAEALAGSGWSWVEAAIYEAVGSGSRFVAPKRVREILARWERDGDGPEDGGPSGGTSGWYALIAPDAPRVEISGTSGRDLWARTLGMLAQTLERSAMLDLFSGTAIAGHRRNVVTIATADAAQADRLISYQDLIGRKLGEVLRRAVEVRIAVRADAGPVTPLPTPVRVTTAAAPVFLIQPSGLASDAVWSAVLADVAASGMVTDAEFDGWVRSTTLLGHGADGALLVGTPHVMAKRRIEGRLLGVLQHAAQRVLGGAPRLEVVVTREWQAQSAAERARVAGD